VTARDRLVPLRPDLGELSGYHSPQADVDVRLNTNESPYPVPDAWRDDMALVLGNLEFHRYPDRAAEALRQALAELHGVDVDQVFCANGSNEVLQCLLLAYGGPTRRVTCFEPTYALHAHISGLTGTPVVVGRRAEDFSLSRAVVDDTLRRAEPVITFLCSPNNPTGRAEPVDLVRHVLGCAPGLVVVDEAYGQFAPSSALELHRDETVPGRERLVVVRTFSKTWSMAAVRLGYLVAEPEVVEACQGVALPYHLSTTTQVAGRLALRYRKEMEERVSAITTERERLSRALRAMPVDVWPSEANFVLFRPRTRPAGEVWSGLLSRSVLIRDCSSWKGLTGCLRVTVGTPEEDDRFLDALGACLA
jgi:histidinol-phosphate aminotransferase